MRLVTIALAFGECLSTRALARAILLLLVAASTGCNGTTLNTTVIPAKLGRAHMIKGAPPASGVVEVDGWSSVWVFQNSQVRAIIEWARDGKGQVVVPLGSIDDGSGQPIFVAVTSPN